MIITSIPTQPPVVPPRTPLLPVVVTTPKPVTITNGNQSQQQAVNSIERKSIPAAPPQQPLRQPLQSSPSSIPSASSSLINTLPKPYPNAPADKREFAFFWLNKNYEVHPQSSFPRVQIYADYQKAHQAQFGSSSGGALSAGDFHAMIK